MAGILPDPGAAVPAGVIPGREIPDGVVPGTLVPAVPVGISPEYVGVGFTDIVKLTEIGFDTYYST